MTDQERLQREVDEVYGRELQRELEDPERLRELYGATWVDGPWRDRARAITDLAAAMLKCEIVQVNLVTDREQICIASYERGKEGAVDVKVSYCQHVVASKSLLVISDAVIHRLVKDSPLVEEYRSYLGIPLTWRDRVLGALCIADHEPRDWTPMEVHVATQLAATLMSTAGWQT